MKPMTAEELLGGIREELMTIQSHAGRVSMHLERIADSLPIPFVPVAELEQRRDKNFRTALQIVRDVLDSGGPGLPGSPNAERLFAAEALLSAELGQPVWEGRKGRS